MDKITRYIWVPQDSLPVVGYEDRYAVDTRGVIYNVRTFSVMKASTNKVTGYRYLNLTKNSICKTFLVHRVVMLAFNPVENYVNLEVNHKDGDKGNNQFTNLEWMGHRDNMTHARDVLDAWADRLPGNPKLTPEQVKDIRRLFAEGMRKIDIAEMFSLADSTIHNVLSRKTWAHVD